MFDPESAPSQEIVPQAYRSVFISDLHLGSVGCKTAAIQAFLHSVHCERLYLVGDIVDGWVGTGRGKWKQEHSNVIRTLLGKSKHGTLVMYTPGNHDAFLRRVNGFELGNTLFEHSFEHMTPTGKRYLVVHGDLFDRTVTKYKRVAYVSAWGYEFVTLMNQSVNRSRAMSDKAPVDFAMALKKAVKRIIKRSTNYDDLIVQHAQDLGYDGVICGHVHKPTITHRPDGMLYVNTGDWVENCTAVVEDFEGNLRLIYWRDLAASRALTTITEDTPAARPKGFRSKPNDETRRKMDARLR